MILGVGQCARLHFLCCGVIVETWCAECLTKISFSVKTIIYTSTLILALCCGSSAVAQNNACTTKSCPDSVLLSKRTDGDYEVRQYLVKGKNIQEADFTVHFPINSAKMSETFSDNSTEIKALKSFMAQFKDTLNRVKSVKIKGWASPDGSTAANQKLAKARVNTFVAYLKAQCPAMKSCAIEISSAVATWKDCLPMLESSSLKSSKAAADIINGNHTEAMKEAHLAKMTEVWAYLKSKVLPEFRCAEIEIDYTQSTIVEQRVLIKKPAQTPAPTTTSSSVTTTTSAPTTQVQPAAQNQPVVIEKQAEYLIIEDKNKGIIIEMDGSNVDW